MGKSRKKILTINEFDSSGESGILADIKCFEQHKVFGVASNYNKEEIIQLIKNSNIDFIKIKVKTENHISLLSEISTFNIPILVLIEDFNSLNSIKGNYIVGDENLDIDSECTLYKLHSNPFDFKNRDTLIHKNKEYPIRQKGKTLYNKNGWRDVFSASIASNIIKGYPIIKASLKAKEYTARFLESDESLTGFHKH